VWPELSLYGPRHGALVFPSRSEWQLLLVNLADEWFSFIFRGVMESIRADVGLSCASRA
jgi:hypothetical protein